MSSFNELQKASVSTAFFMVLKLFSEGPHPSGIALGNRNNFPGYALDFDFEKEQSSLPEDLSVFQGVLRSHVISVTRVNEAF